MAEALEIPQSNAVALFLAMGLKTAKKWDCDKLTKKINEIEAEPDEPFEDEELDELMDSLLDADEAVVIPDEAEDEDDEDVDDDGDDDDDGEEKKTAKKKAKGKGKAKGKTKDKKKTKGKAKKTAAPGRKRENSIDAVTLGLIKSKPMTLESLMKQLTLKFPDNDPDTLKRTTKRRLTGYLQAKYGVEIEKSAKGAYSVK
jgi:hypothetical protein